MCYLVKKLGRSGVSPDSEQKPLRKPCPKIKKSIISAMLLKHGFSLVSKVKIPLVTEFWLASGPATVLADPPGVTARSAMACHAPRSPVHSSAATLRPLHCAITDYRGETPPENVFWHAC